MVLGMYGVLLAQTKLILIIETLRFFNVFKIIKFILGKGPLIFRMDAVAFYGKELEVVVLI